MSNIISSTLETKDKNITFEDKIEEKIYKEGFPILLRQIYSPAHCELFG